MSLTAAHTAGSSGRWSHPSGRCRSSSERIGGDIHDATCTPLVTWPIGTSSSDAPGYSGRHMSRATCPCRRLTPFAARDSLSPSTVMPTSAEGSSGGTRPSPSTDTGSTPISEGRLPTTRRNSSAVYVSLPAATGVCVVNTVFCRAASTASSNDSPEATPSRTSSSGAIAACPSFRWNTPGSIPIARIARTPPRPSSAYWARRISRSPTYSRDVIHRSTTWFSGRSESSR
jgi:hypothetical protein